MSIERIKKLLKQKESITLEFKSAEKGLPENIFQTVCAFLNREGGDIILGVKDDGTVSGINKDSLPKMCNDISAASNNPQTLNPVFLLIPKIYEINGKSIIHIPTPESSRIHDSKGIIYDRSSEGDFYFNEIFVILFFLKFNIL